MERGLGVSTSWLTMGSLEGKQIPEELRDAVVEFNRDVHDLTAAYKGPDRHRLLMERARALGLEEWLRSRAPGLWGTPQDVAERLAELGAQGLDRWMFFVGRGDIDKAEQVRLICEEVLPRLPAPASHVPA
jgi:hypothetical protein